MIRRILDILLAVFISILISPIFLFLTILGYLNSGSPFYTQLRIGINEQPFMLIKFRSMKINTTYTLSHKVEKSQITSYGNFIRKYKLDELPQLWNILRGDMSFVGPRPNLINHNSLICLRRQRNLYSILPGLTGYAQINGIGMDNEKILVEYDEKNLNHTDLGFYFYCILITLKRILHEDNRKD